MLCRCLFRVIPVLVLDAHFFICSFRIAALFVFGIMDFDILYAAAISGDTDAIAKLEIEANKSHEYGRNILHIESMYGNTENVRFIVREFANKNLLLGVDWSGGTALHLAAEKGYTQVVEVLLDAARCLPSAPFVGSRNPVTPFQAFVRQPNKYRNTALHIAVSKGKVDIAKLLVEADPDDSHIQNSHNESPVYTAADLGYNNIVKIISTTCTAPSLEGPHGQTAFHAAIRNLHKAKREDRDVFRVLIDAAKRSENYGRNTSLKSLFVLPYALGSASVLHQAVQGNHLDEVKMIIAEKSAFKRQIEDSDCDLKTLINTATERGYKDMVKYLCKIYEAENALGQKGLTALLGAIRVRDKESVLQLLGDDKRLVTYEDDVGWTPLHYAADCEFDSILNDTVQAQAYVGYQYVSGDNMVPTPLIIAAKKGYTSTVIQLMKLLPAPSCVDVDDDGRNILHLAAVERNIEMIRCILKYCPEEYSDKILNNKDDNGDTPLHLLIREGCFVPELIKHKGVDTRAVNNNNLTPLDMLYFNDEIISEQVQIKEALDTKATQNWKFWRRSVKGKSNLQESLVPPSKRSKKDAEFKKAREVLMSEKQKRMKADLERYKKRTNTQIIVTALITTVTFTVGFTMPGGYHQSGEPDQGLVLLSRKSAFQTFMVADALALLLSTSSLFLYFIESMYEDPQQVAKINAASTGLNIVSVIAMMLTFITGTYVVLSHSPVLAVTVCVVGSFFFLFVAILLIKMIWDRKLDRHQVQKVSHGILLSVSLSLPILTKALSSFGRC